MAGLAPWIAASALGWSVTNAALQNVGDVSYAFDKWTGTKFPNDDVATYQNQHKYAIQNGSQQLAVWIGTASSRKSGIQFAIDYEYDGYSIGSISMRLLDTYDWPLWGGSYNVTITPKRELAGDSSIIRFTLNALWTSTIASGGDSGNFELTADNNFSLADSSANLYIDGAGILVAANELSIPGDEKTAVAMADSGGGSPTA